MATDRLEQLVALYDLDDESSDALRDALRPIPSSACMRALFAWPLRVIVVGQGDAFVARYVELERRLRLVRNPFAWVPLTDFILRWTFAGHIAHPDLPLETATARLVEDHVAILSRVPTVRTLLEAGGNDVRAYLVNGIESAGLFHNFGENILLDHGPGWVESVAKATYWPAFRYIQTPYNAGVFRLFGVDGQTTYSDTCADSFTIRSEWQPR